MHTYILCALLPANNDAGFDVNRTVFCQIPNYVITEKVILNINKELLNTIYISLFIIFVLFVYLII